MPLREIQKTAQVILELLAPQLRRMGVRERSSSLSVAFVGEKRIAELNTQYRGKRGATDVLSFPLHEAFEEDYCLGEVIICPAVAKKQSPLFGTSYEEELDRLLIHGVLHLMGYDHETVLEAKRMKQKEKWIWRELND